MSDTQTGKAFNGSTVELVSATGGTAAVYNVLDYSGSDSVTPIDDKDGGIGTGGGDDVDYVEPGSRNSNVSFSMAGLRLIQSGKKYEVTVKAPDGTVVDDYGSMLCTGSTSTGSHNSMYKQSVTFSPTRSLQMPWS